jgi:hypothetical protein
MKMRLVPKLHEHQKSPNNLSYLQKGEMTKEGLCLCRNELRPANGVAATWGNGERNDWALAAERAGNLILGIVDFKPLAKKHVFYFITFATNCF